jgi:hypothetical protein
VPAIQKYHKLDKKTSGLQTAAVAAALSQKLVYAKQRVAGSPAADAKSLDAMDTALMDFRLAMLHIYPELCDRVNFLFGRHFKEAVRNYGIGGLLSVCMEEMFHGLYKHRVILRMLQLCLAQNVHTLDCICRSRGLVDARSTWT